MEETEKTENMPSPSAEPAGTSGILSTSVSREEYSEIKELSSSLGVSISHMGRAILRLGLMNIKGVSDEARSELHLRLIKLGK